MASIETTTKKLAGISSVVKLHGKGNYQEWRMQLWRVLNSLDDSYWRILTTTEKPKINVPQPIPSTDVVRNSLSRQTNVPASQVTLSQVFDFKRNVIRGNKILVLWQTGDAEVFPLLKATLTAGVADTIKEAQSACEAYHNIVRCYDSFSKSREYQTWDSWITCFYGPHHDGPEHFLEEWQEALQNFIATHGEGAEKEKCRYLQFLWAVQHSREMGMKNWYPDPQIDLAAPGFLDEVYDDFLVDAEDHQPWILEDDDASTTFHFSLDHNESLMYPLSLVACTLVLCTFLVLVFRVAR